MTSTRTVLVIGATGQVGHLVVEEALAHAMTVKAQTRSAKKAQSLPQGVEIIEGNPFDPQLIDQALEGVDLVVFTLGGDLELERVFYASTLSLVRALQSRPHVHLSYMTSMGISHATNERWAWKRRSERLVRASGVPYTIVRPGWFDYQGPEDTRIDLRQGDLVTGRPGVDRHHIAQVLINGALEASGTGKTFEIFSTSGEPITDFGALFAHLTPDSHSGRGALDRDDVPLESEPERVRRDIAELESHVN